MTATREPDPRPTSPPTASRRRWRRIVVPVLTVVVAAVTAVAALAYPAFLRSPAGSPGQLCAQGRPGDTDQVVVAAGASLTHGSLSADWVGALRGRLGAAGYTFVNAGRNGNTSQDLRERLDADVVSCRPNAVALLIGTNDVLGDVGPDRYRANLEAIVDHLRATTTARIALLSLPPLGEDLDSARNQELERYNATIREVTITRQLAYLPLHEQLTALLHGREDAAAGYDFSFPLAFYVAFERYVLRNSWDEIADGNGLRVLTDHVHLSDRGGTVVADLVAGWLGSAS
ncbi:GDSL-type esterase/lipase family protein [Micromonospora sp. WMMD1082]|uniref:SGNH/GDSL hydrolase family protein n=1 Tax=Micromonospora sp. WMMD1082 TaxID=3016104 RepID=UPI0024176A63|nr:GDSL-type esterase/lipase family protein [Micromonospora sp. WMMD1082]MDG4797588.1 GDSL-type esterase/lipase family protein [Micromonospora sp. WMMD1082]